jgi:hypothetical protein
MLMIQQILLQSYVYTRKDSLDESTTERDLVNARDTDNVKQLHIIYKIQIWTFRGKKLVVKREIEITP